MALTPEILRGVRPVQIQVDCRALAHNIQEVHELCGRPVNIIAALKANACGNGVLGIARCLERLNVYAIATGDASEAIALREAGVQCRILMFPCHLGSGIPTLMRQKLIPTVSSFAGASAVSSAAVARGTEHGAYPVFVKVDCGLGRFGVLLDEAEQIISRIAELPGIAIEGIYTHLPFHDQHGAEWAQRRLRRFETLVSGLARLGIRIPIAQAAASAVIASKLEDHLNTVCPAHLLFGLCPFDSSSPPAGFRPVTKALTSRLIHVASYPEQIETVGRFDPTAVRRIGIFLLGIENGYGSPVHGAPANVLIRGRRAPVLGVTAEYTVVDLTHLPDASLEDVVVIIGTDGAESITVAEAATGLGMSPLQFLIGLRGIPYNYLPL
jgi:alanine racemase